MKIKKKYDYVIVGGGIAGLVCGCYLAKTGLRVLIIEKEPKAGGYCTSFRRSGYVFDSCVHYMGGLRKEGKFRQIFDDLSLGKYVDIESSDPHDTILFGEKKIEISNDINKTMESLTQISSREDASSLVSALTAKKNIMELLGKDRSLSFEEYISRYTKNEVLKNVVRLLLCNLGVSSERASAISALSFFKEFIFDGGYYPKGGFQNLANAFFRRYKDYGGDFVFNSEVSNILDDAGMKGVVVNDDKIYTANIIWACSLHSLMKILSEKGESFLQTYSDLNDLSVSLPVFALYLGIDNSRVKVSEPIGASGSMWYMAEGSVLAYLNELYGDNLDNFGKYLLIATPGYDSRSEANSKKVSLYCATLTAYISSQFWKENKLKYQNKLISSLKQVFPKIENMIDVTDSASPETFKRYTNNRNGAIYGWPITPSIFNNEIFKTCCSLKNIHIAGHWKPNILGHGGVSGVAIQSARLAEHVILKNKKVGVTL